MAVGEEIDLVHSRRGEVVDGSGRDDEIAGGGADLGGDIINRVNYPI